MSLLPSDLYRYRKRSKLSLDGTVAGLHFNKHRRQIDTQASLGALGAPADAGYLGTPNPNDYDPHPGFMTDLAPNIDQPEPFAPSQATPTPPVRFVNEPFLETRLPGYDDALCTQEMTDQLFAQDMQTNAQDPIPIDHDVMAQDLFNAEPQAEPASPGPHALEYDIQVQDAFDSASPDPHEQMSKQFEQQMQLEDPVPDPFHPDYVVLQQQMFDEQMQMLLNPFMMPGP